MNVDATQAGLVDSRTAAKLLGISMRKLSDLAVSGEVPSVKIGRKRKFDPDELRRWWRDKMGVAAVAA